MAGKRLDGYVRVSQVRGREGDGFISPKEQRAQIDAWASANGVQIVAWHEELDVSGGRMERPKLREAIDRCKEGKTEGIVVAKRDRFARSLLGALQTIQELEEAGAIFAAADGLDSSTPEGKFAVNLMLSMADYELQRYRRNWRTATERAVADGVHLGRTPPGYLRANGKRSGLVLDPETAPVIKETFARRTQGASWRELTAFLRGHGIERSSSGVQEMLRSRTYLGEVRGPQGAVNLEAHEPLVTVEEWQAAQRPGRAPEHTGRFSAETMLSGLITCAGCGRLLSVTGAGKGEKRRAQYYCRKDRTHGCPSPAGAVAAPVDQFVRDALAVVFFDGTLETTMDAVQRYASAEQAMHRAEQDLDALADPRLLQAFGQERYIEMVEQQRAALDEARGALDAIPKPGDAVVPDPDVFGPEWDMPRQRQLARQFIAEITLRPAEGYGRGAEPVGQRLSVTWAGHDAPDATLYERVEKMLAELPAFA